MEVKKAIKRVFALAAGATMLGATLFSAMAAADLANYPAPFVKDGKFDAFIVVGDKAAAEDVVGAVDIGASLQFEMKKETMVSSGTDSVLVSDGVKIKGTGSEVLNYGETLGDVRDTALDAEDLPVLLADGRYVESEGPTDNDETYTQELLLKKGNGKALFDQDDTDANRDANDYLEIYDTGYMYLYSLQFDEDVEYDVTDANNDLEGTQIEIQGNLYTITDIKLDGADLLDDMTLMAGDTLLWLMQDQIVEKTVAGVRHEIKVVDVTDSEDSCGVSVDGNIAWIDVRSDKTINGVNIGVLDAKAVHAQLQDVDICELNIGATEIKISGAADDATPNSWNGDIEVDGMDIDGAEVELTSAAAGRWAGLEIAFTPDDDVYLAKDQEFRDPVLSNFKVLMGGVVTPRELIDGESDGARRGKVTFLNNEGKKVELPIRIEDPTTDEVQWGDGNDKTILVEGDNTDCANAVELQDCKGEMFYAVTSGKSAHVLELTRFRSSENRIELKDLTYGRTFSDNIDIVDNPALASNVDLGSLGYILLNLDYDCSSGACIYADDLGAPIAQTSYGADLEVFSMNSNSGTGCAINTQCQILELTEQDIDDENIDIAGGRVIAMNVDYDDTTDQQLEFYTNADGATEGDFTWPTVGIDKTYDDSDTLISSTAHGTLIEWDSNDNKWVKMSYPKQEVEVNAFLAPVAAQISTSGGNIATVTLDKINVGAARLASEISDVTKDNLILVGGACANQVTATVEGVSASEPDCLAGLQAGEAVIKLYEQSTGKVAMVVAGRDALDTRRATRVVSNFDAYKMSGSEVKVTGTSLTDIKVSVPS